VQRVTPHVFTSTQIRGCNPSYVVTSAGVVVIDTPQLPTKALEMRTQAEGVWAAGDVTTYPGKLKLIACGFGEAATAVNQAVHWMYPEKKVAPGHSSNMAIFGQKDE